MANTIKVTPNENGRAIITLYGQDIDVTDKADKDGKGFLHFAGDDYIFEIVKDDKPAGKKPAKKAKKAKAEKKVEVEGAESEAETLEVLETLEEERSDNEA